MNGEKLSVTWRKSHRKEISISRIWLDDMSTRAHKMVSSMYIYEGGGGLNNMSQRQSVRSNSQHFHPLKMSALSEGTTMCRVWVSGSVSALLLLSQ